MPLPRVTASVPVLVSSAFLLLCGFVAGAAFADGVSAAQGPRVFELRTYTAPEGKLGDLHARFRDHTLRLFERHGITNIVYLKPLDAPLSDNTLVYLLAHPSREAAKANWAKFAADPEWKKVASESQANGRILSKVESVYFEAADYSPMK
jgi:hypothetical protein